MKKTYIIAEAGVNHNGNMQTAKDLIDVAVKAGADVVKFQTFKAGQVVSLSAPKAKYQLETTASEETQFEMLQALELSRDNHFDLQKYCASKKILFLSTAFGLESVDLLDKELKLPLMKIPSGELTNGPLLLKFAHTGKPMIISTGMCTLDDIKAALTIVGYGLVHPAKEPQSFKTMQSEFESAPVQNALKDKVSLLHCTTEYPTPFEDVNLKAIDTLRDTFGLPVGFSDHSKGINMPIAAVARGATIIEKHFTLDQNMPGPDHKASLSPAELIAMVQGIREVEKALGDGQKLAQKSELKNMDIARRRLTALQDIPAGTPFNAQNMGCLRPGNGISPLEYWDYLTKKASKNYKKGEAI